MFKTNQPEFNAHGAPFIHARSSASNVGELGGSALIILSELVIILIAESASGDMAPSVERGACRRRSRSACTSHRRVMSAMSSAPVHTMYSTKDQVMRSSSL